MGESGVGGPAMAPLNVERGEERWRHFDNSVNAVSFGFVATAILISMFLVMAIFERFLRPRSPLLSSNDGRMRRPSSSADLEAQRRRGIAGKLDYPSPKVALPHHTPFLLLQLLLFYYILGEKKNCPLALLASLEHLSSACLS